MTDDMTDEQQSYDIDDNAATEAEIEDAGRAERIAEIKRLALEGALEAPADADEIVEALVDALRERDEIFARLQHTVADHQNFVRRASNNEREARTQAQTGVLQSVIPVLDHFELALGQNPDTTTAEGVIGGVRMIRSELLRVLGQFGVGTIAPESGDEFDPNRHEAVMKEKTSDVDPGAVARTLSVGYVLGERVVRPAKVAVAEAALDDAGGEG